MLFRSESEEELAAVVPADLPAGTHALEIRFPDGRQAPLEAAYTAAPPTLVFVTGPPMIPPGVFSAPPEGEAPAEGAARARAARAAWCPSSSGPSGPPDRFSTSGLMPFQSSDRPSIDTFQACPPGRASEPEIYLNMTAHYNTNFSLMPAVRVCAAGCCFNVVGGVGWPFSP